MPKPSATACVLLQNFAMAANHSRSTSNQLRRSKKLTINDHQFHTMFRKRTVRANIIGDHVVSQRHFPQRTEPRKA